MPTIPRRAYHRPTVRELTALRSEVMDAVEKVRHIKGKSGVQAIAQRENIEQGLLLILATDLWWSFKEVYRFNTDTELYLDWVEYRDP